MYKRQAAISTDISKLVGLALMIRMFFKSRRVKMGMSYPVSYTHLDVYKRQDGGDSEIPEGRIGRFPSI